MIYFDNSATTQVFPESAERTYHAMTVDFYNPAGAYGAAYSVEKQVERARSNIADYLHVSPSEIYYTSGATESNNIAVFGMVSSARGKKRIITTMIEHPSVYESIRFAASRFGFEIVYAPLNDDGTINLKEFLELLDDRTFLVSIMHVNNELGSVNDLSSIADSIHRNAPEAVFHSDGVQAFLKTDLVSLPCDLYSVSGHKFHAPKGVGFLYMKKGIRNTGGQIGGGQENNFRSGTTNVPGILGMDTALSIYRSNLPAWHEHMRTVKKRLFCNLSTIPDTLLNGPSVESGAPHILNMSFLGVRAEVLLHALEQHGVIVSTGSACSSKKLGKNRILSSVGITGNRQEGAVRFSFSPMNTVEEADIASSVIEEQVRFLRRYKRR